METINMETIRKYYTTIYAKRKLSQKEIEKRLKDLKCIEKGGSIIFCNTKKRLYCSVIWSGKSWVYMYYYKI